MATFVVMLNLKKSLVFLDVEATGLNIVNDRITEIALLKLNTDGSQHKWARKINPEKEIPQNITEITGISNEDVKDKPKFKEIAKELSNFIGSSDLAGYNPFKLDLPMLMEEFMRAEVDFDVSKRKVIDVQRIFHMMEKRTLAAAYNFFCGKVLENEHTAEADTAATYEIFLAQLERYQELGSNVEDVSKATGNPGENILDLAGRIIKDDKGNEVFNFGKYKGQKVTDVLTKDPAYYGWMMRGEFTNYTKKKLTEIRLKMKN